MKQVFLTGMLSFFAFSCSQKDHSQVQPTASQDVPTSVVSNVSGQTLIETSDCLACHSMDEKMIGPSYRDIAAKYSEKDIEMLASKIIEGGSGVW